MGIKDNIEQLKGRAKEAIGDKTDNPDLVAEGQNDQASGKTKDKVDQAADKVNDGIDSLKDKANKQ